MDFKTILKEQREELLSIEKRERLIAREGQEEARTHLRHPNILAVLGIRRCGKSIFSYLLAKGAVFGYVNFDDERLSDIAAADLNALLQAVYELHGNIRYLILDEIQNVTGWELFVNRLRRTKQVILTGSNSKLLSGELATHLTGRYIDVTLFPFSFREFLRLHQWQESAAYTTREKAQLLAFLSEYLEVGGFPESSTIGKAMLPRIYNDILTKDILLRHRIRKGEELKKLARYLITNAAEEFTYRKAASVVGIKNLATISTWVSYLEQAFLLFTLQRFDFKLKQQFLAPKKSYCIDPGMVNAVGFAFSENRGRIMESAVFLQLQRKRAIAQELELYYWKDYQQHEVDFVLKRGKAIAQLIQVQYALAKEEIREREITALLKASRVLRCAALLVITWDYEGEDRRSGKTIRYLPLWKWLLQ